MSEQDRALTQRDITALMATLDKLDRTIEHLREEIATTYVRKDVLSPRLDDLRRDVDKHAEWFTWAARIVVGALIVGLIGLLITSQGALA